MKLNFWNATWPLDVNECPCDIHFVDYLRARSLRGRAIFHFGTGEHHVVALENAKMRQPNQIFGVTASKQEYDSYIELIIGQPRVANSYKAMFVDIYTLEPKLLPEFDIVTLFHLGEFHDPVRQKYAPLDDRKLLDLMVRKLKPGGLVCFYRGSNGWGKSHHHPSSVVGWNGFGTLGWSIAAGRAPGDELPALASSPAPHPRARQERGLRALLRRLLGTPQGPLTQNGHPPQNNNTGPYDITIGRAPDAVTAGPVNYINFQLWDRGNFPTFGNGLTLSSLDGQNLGTFTIPAAGIGSWSILDVGGSVLNNGFVLQGAFDLDLTKLAEGREGDKITFAIGHSSKVPANVVPEPGTIALLGIGLMGLAGVRRKRRQ